MRKYEFTRTVKGCKVSALVFNPATEQNEIRAIEVATTSNAKDFTKSVAEGVKPMHLLMVKSAEDFEELRGCTLEKFLEVSVKLENRNGKELEG